MIASELSPLKQWQDQEVNDQLAIWWLGQAGFLFKTARASWIVDPYLSDSLEPKYRDAYYKHDRMIPIPIAPSEITGLDWIFSTHSHTDHMDIGTLPDLIKANPEAEFIAPAAAATHITTIGIEANTLRLVRQNQELELSNAVKVHVLQSAHETLDEDQEGDACFLGYVFEIGSITIYHAGDCIPYAGLADRLKELGVQIAMLPVNGRSEELASRGIAGNFHFQEAVDICREANISTLIPHHFGMFAFNTADPADFKPQTGLEVVLPLIDNAILIS